MTEEKQTYKLKPIHKQFIIKKIAEGEKSSKKIVEELKKEYNVSVSSTRISQIRQQKHIMNNDFFSQSMQAKMNKKKAKIDFEMIEVAEDVVHQTKRWFQNNKDKIPNYSAKEISTIMGQFHKFLKSYQDMMGSPVSAETTSTLTTIQSRDKLFEQMSREKNAKKT